jgi:hypothetical protein
MGAALSAGDGIILGIMGFNAGTNNSPPTFAVSDSVNGSWGSAEVLTVTLAYGGTQGVRYSLWAFPNSGAGTPVITITISFTQQTNVKANMGALAAAFSGLATTSVYDTGAAATGTGTAPASGNVSPATGASSELMIGCYLDAGEGTTLSVGNVNGSAGTLAGKHDADSGKWQGLLEYRDAGSSGGTPSAAAVSTGSPTEWGMLGAVFTLSGAAAVIPPGLGPVPSMQEPFLTDWALAR